MKPTMSVMVVRTIEDDGQKAPSVSFAEAGRLNRLLMNVRHELVPWLLSTSSSRAVLKTTPYASDLSALARAREALQFGDAAMAATALEGVGTGDTAIILSEESYNRERLFAFGPASWGNDFEQDIRPVSPELFRLYQRLRGGSAGPDDVAAVQRLEAQARGHLEEVLLLIAGKLRRAAASLE